MIGCLMITSLIYIILGVFVKDIDFKEMLCGFGIVTFMVKLGILILLLVILISYRYIDDKIELYENQNREIENKVKIVVEQYMEHEKKTFKELKGTDSYMTLVTLYPELKSDKLISEEIALYEENNKKIAELKEQKIDAKIYKWWIYFGD